MVVSHEKNGEVCISTLQKLHSRAERDCCAGALTKISTTIESFTIILEIFQMDFQVKLMHIGDFAVSSEQWHHCANIYIAIQSYTKMEEDVR